MLKSQTYRRFVYEKAFCGHSGCHTHSQRCGLRKKARAAGRTRCARSGRGNCAGTSAAANAVFDELSQTVISYAQETVYPAAQEKAAIGYVNGGYSISEENGTLIVSYTLSVSYSTETGDQQFLHTYYIDLTTGELLKEE